MTSQRRATTGGIGVALRGERERLRVSLDAVERGTLIRREFLELIDTERLDRLPPGAYAKGFIRSYATYLGLDPMPFVKAYEEWYAQPEPELARVVRRGVRVPPDLQRRAWKIAVGGAASALLLLGLLGVFRSDGRPEELPKVSVAASRISEPAPNPMGAIVTVDITGEASWVEAEADGQRIFGETLERGESRTFKGSESVVIYLARAREVSIVANGKVLGTPDLGSYKGVFTPSTAELPPPEELGGDASEGSGVPAVSSPDPVGPEPVPVAPQQP